MVCVVVVVVDGGLAAFGAAAAFLALLVIVLGLICSDRLWLNHVSDWLSALILTACALARFSVLGVVMIGDVRAVWGGLVDVSFSRNIRRLL